MHFSIPDTVDLKDENGVSYIGYQIHVNGVHHCTVRYRQMFELNEQLKRDEEQGRPPVNFPPKKLLSLTPAQMEHRRDLLEKYLQSLSQMGGFAKSEAFSAFLLRAQKETRSEVSEHVQIKVYLVNGHEMTIDVMTTSQTEEVLQAVVKSVNLPDHLTHYFTLYMVKSDKQSQFTLVRKLQDFESPYISLKQSSFTHRIVLRKSYWDNAFDEDLLDDRVAMNLIFVQAVSEMDLNWLHPTAVLDDRLQKLRAVGSKKEFLRTIRQCRYYNYTQFNQCMTSYPSHRCSTIILAGNNELIFRISTPEGEVKEGCFKVTRMRCWRITSSIDGQSGDTDPASPQHEISFEYLMSKDKLQWINIQSEQAIMMSVCLQGMVDELLRKRQGNPLRKTKSRQVTYAAGREREELSLVENGVFSGIGDDDL